MHLTDDCDLIGELQEAMSARAASIEVPGDMIAGARRTARRRSATRAATVGVPVLAAAGVTTALVVGGGSSAQRVSITPSHGAPPQAGAAPATHAQDTAYIVRRLRAQLAADRRDVFQTIGEGGGVTNADWLYVDPRSGVQYQRDVATSAGGAPLYTNVTVATPIDHVLHFRVTALDPVHHTYTVTDSVASGPEASRPSPAGRSDPGAGINSSAAQVDRALRSGRVTQAGTTTIEGRPAIRLTMPATTASIAGQTTTTTTTLYVDATSDQPLREVHANSTASGAGATVTENWLPATPANITLAEPAHVPAGYRQVPFTSTATN